MKPILKFLPWFFLALFATEIVAVMLPKKDGDLHVAEFGRLPALLNGRIQPLDSIARNSLLQIRSTGDVPLELLPSWQFWRHPKKLKSTEWLLEVFFTPELADTRAIFLIHHPDLISEFKLGEKGIEKSGLRYYTFNDMSSLVGEIMKQASKASEVKAEQQTSYQKQVLKLANAINIYQRLKSSIQPEGTENFVQLLADYQAALPDGLKAMKAQQAGREVDVNVENRRTTGNSAVTRIDFNNNVIGEDVETGYNDGASKTVEALVGGVDAGGVMNDCGGGHVEIEVAPDTVLTSC